MQDCRVLLCVHVMAPALLTTVGTEWGTPELKAVCSQSCHVTLGCSVEIQKCQGVSQKSAEWKLWTPWDWHRTGLGKCHWCVWQHSLCSSRHPKSRSCFFGLCCLEKKNWQDKQQPFSLKWIPKASFPWWTAASSSAGVPWWEEYFPKRLFWPLAL